ncbi:Zn-dependent exopeptidase, partial [Ramicandelaber brevisporus]
SIGKTIEGRDIFAVEISSPSRLRPDGTPKKTAYHEFNMHAREWLTSAVGQYYADSLVKAYRSKDARVTAILDNTVIALVPVVNPDGYAYTWTTDRMWRKNRRNNGNDTFGVDLNRNFPLFWGKEGASDDPASDSFYGAHPASEPETRAIMKYYSSLKNKITALEVHTCAQFIGYPFGGTAQLPQQPDLDNFKTIATKMADTAAKGGGKKYRVFNLYNDLVPFTGLSIDYFYKPDNSTRAVYSLAFEFRRGNND